MTFSVREGGLAARGLLCSAGALLACLLVAAPAAAAPPPNNNFASAEALTGTSDSATGTNVEATKQVGEPDHAGDPGGASVWYTWTAPSSGPFKVDTCASDFDTLLSVYTGSAVNSLTEVASNDQGVGCGNQSKLAFQAASGTTYRIAVDGWSSFGEGPADTGQIGLNLAAEPLPSNDSFSTPEDLGASSDLGTFSDNIGATKQGGEPNHAGNSGGASVWYSWTAPITGRYLIDTCNTDFETLLAVYTGSAVGSLTPVASDHDSCGFGSLLELTAVGGTEFRIAVDGFAGATGNFGLAIDFLTPPPNDNFASAQTLSGFNAVASGDNLDAGVEGGELAHFSGGPYASVWYSWTAPASGQVTIDTCGSDFDTVLAVYTGNAVNALSRIASNDDAPACPPRSKLILNVNGGTTYRIAVDGFFDEGNIALRISLPIAPVLDSKPPQSRIRKLIVDSEHQKATIRFGSSEAGSTFRCKLDGKPFRPCSSPKTYRNLDDGWHKVKVQARDAAGNLDPSSAVRRFEIES